MPEKCLLQVIGELVGCFYISDIPSGWLLHTGRENIRLIPNEIFPLEEWCSAVEYITKTPCMAETVAQAKAQLLNKK